MNGIQNGNWLLNVSGCKRQSVRGTGSCHAAAVARRSYWNFEHYLHEIIRKYDFNWNRGVKMEWWPAYYNNNPIIDIFESLYIFLSQKNSPRPYSRACSELACTTVHLWKINKITHTALWGNHYPSRLCSEFVLEPRVCRTDVVAMIDGDTQFIQDHLPIAWRRTQFSPKQSEVNSSPEYTWRNPAKWTGYALL